MVPRALSLTGIGTRSSAIIVRIRASPVSSWSSRLWAS